MRPGCFGMLLVAFLLSMFAFTVRAEDAAATPTSQPAPVPSDIYGFTVTDIDGKPFDFAQFKGHPLLIVNVASKCGFTRQYAGLESIYTKYKDQGLVVIGFPSNSFKQELDSDAEVKAFCAGKFNVTFPMMSKVSVKGDDKAPIFKFLTEPATAGTNAKEVNWNFNKFLVGKDGKLITHFKNTDEPDAPGFVSAIEAAIATQ